MSGRNRQVMAALKGQLHRQVLDSLGSSDPPDQMVARLLAHG